MKFYNFAKNEETGDIELRITGEIVSDDDAWLYEWFGVSHTAPNSFREELNKFNGQDIVVWIDSWGGDVFAGAGIYNALMEHKGNVTVKVDGKAVSAASIIAMAGTEVLMSPASIMMLHNPWTQQVGEAKDLRKTAEVLDEVKLAIMNAYEIKTGRTREEISMMMDNETWMSAKTAIAEGFADDMLYMRDTEDGATVENAYSLSGMAIQNSASKAMKKFFELFREQEAGSNNIGENSASNRVFNKKRVNVREKSHRRYLTHE